MIKRYGGYFKILSPYPSSEGVWEGVHNVSHGLRDDIYFVRLEVPQNLSRPSS